MYKKVDTKTFCMGIFSGVLLVLSVWSHRIQLQKYKN